MQLTQIVHDAPLSALQLRRRYVFALSLIALLTVVSQLVVQYLIADQEHDSRVINIAGRQRMLSQKITKAALYVARASSPAEADQFRAQLREALDLWTRSHTGLQNGDLQTGLPGHNSPEVTALFEGIERPHAAMVQAATSLLAAANESVPVGPALATLRLNEPTFLSGMDAIVFLYDRQAKDKVALARWLELGLMSVTLVVLFLEAIFIFSPATRRIEIDVRELAQNEQDMGQLFSASPTALIMVDAASLEVMMFNHKARTLMRQLANEATTVTLSQLLAFESQTSREWMERMRRREALDEIEVSLRGEADEEIAALASVRPMKFSQTQVFVIGLTDITGRKASEAALQRNYQELQAAQRQLDQVRNQLVQADKMAAVGQLAAGVAHEINTPAGYIHSNLGSLHRYAMTLIELVQGVEDIHASLPLDDPRRVRLARSLQEADLEFLKPDMLSLVQESQAGIARIREIVGGLKDFSHLDQALWQEVDLNQALDATLKMVRHEIASKAEVVKNYAAATEVSCVASQINQVFMNLLVNAAQAIETFGTITLRTGSDADQVWVDIEDTGRGMNEETRRRIFEPFFTTKPVGEGTGLGLSVCWDIVVKTHHGQFDVKSEVGNGTWFRITLPKHSPTVRSTPTIT